LSTYLIKKNLLLRLKAQYVQFLKEENKILRARGPGSIPTRPEERERLIKFGKTIGRAIEELLTIVGPSAFYQWLREEQGGIQDPAFRWTSSRGARSTQCE
jgi:hypothetical protein